MSVCELCPRRCGVNREAGELGFCGQGATMRIARAALHPFEEPSISGSRGSGTVFFVGCTLRCVYCQNRAISRSETAGRAISEEELAGILLELQEKGAHNINFVTPTHFTDPILRVLHSVKERLRIPVVWNTSGYERTETLRRLEGLVDVYLPDFKYAEEASAQRYSLAPGYPEVALGAIAEMVRQTGTPLFDGEGMLLRGTVVRHLILPGHRKESIAALRALADAVSPHEILLSLMSQYTPEFATDSPYRNLHRRLTSFEYDSVLREAQALGFSGYMQERSSAKTDYTPNF
ncbi:MAG: radical SAM protein [Clostridia bacterium]|nr:radical SAM protein [Clostridia bacterium]